MAQYRLRETHIHTTGAVLAGGTVVGDGTPWEWGIPSTSMEGLDAEGKKKVNEVHQAAYGRDADWPVAADVSPAQRPAPPKKEDKK